MNNNNLLMTIENCIEIDNNKIVIKGCVKSGYIRPGDKVYIIDTYGKRISTTVEAAEMFGKCLDYAESGDSNIGILLGNNIVSDDIKVGYQIISDVSLNATEAESVIEDSYDENGLYNCGLYYADNQEYTKAIKFFEIAAENNNADALNILGDLYYTGEIVSQNYTKAALLYERAVNLNSSDSYYNLGCCYRWGNGVCKDKEKAKELFKKGIMLDNEHCKEAYEDMLKNADRIETAKKIGGGILNVLGAFGGAYAQAYYSDDDDDE